MNSSQVNERRQTRRSIDVTSGDKDRSSRNQSMTSGRPPRQRGWQAIYCGGVRGMKIVWWKGTAGCRGISATANKEVKVPRIFPPKSLAHSIHLAEELVYFNKQPRHDSGREGGEEKKKWAWRTFPSQATNRVNCNGGL
ncbi:hypothetical protein CDAR_278831 [Caerostris darwini]|uniref:Uncharacterized protein n=1 Tax=Caerostris darwini TaxID=1538125 RepID=A0AAV4WSC7_9ARAC|nr:hypothetical protein CDAR_278831 [Caerostris darwini]